MLVRCPQTGTKETFYALGTNIPSPWYRVEMKYFMLYSNCLIMLVVFSQFECRLLEGRNDVSYFFTSKTSSRDLNTWELFTYIYFKTERLK